MMRARGWVVALGLVAGVIPALAQHDGDLIYGGVGGQVQVVDPTNLLTTPRQVPMRFRAASGSSPAFFESDLGFDFFDFPGTGITTVAEARIVSLGITGGLLAADNQFSYFSPGAQRSSFLLRGSARHKHFTFYTLNVHRPQTYEWRFRLTEAKDTLGRSLADSPMYRVHFRPTVSLIRQTPGLVSVSGTPWQPEGGAMSVVPEPVTGAALATGLLGWWARRRRVRS